jgi:hypothetical protein
LSIDSPVDWSVNCTDSGLIPLVGTAVNLAVGGGGTVVTTGLKPLMSVHKRWRAFTRSPTARGEEMGSTTAETAANPELRGMLFTNTSTKAPGSTETTVIDSCPSTVCCTWGALMPVGAAPTTIAAEVTVEPHPVTLAVM